MKLEGFPELPWHKDLGTCTCRGCTVYDRLMIWSGRQTLFDAKLYARHFVDQHMRDSVRGLDGPYGYAIYKAMLIKEQTRGGNENKAKPEGL